MILYSISCRSKNGASHRMNFDTPPLEGSWLVPSEPNGFPAKTKNLPEGGNLLVSRLRLRNGSFHVIESFRATQEEGCAARTESRDQSLNTKLTKTEIAAVKAASEADGRVLGEWVREVVLKEARSLSGAHEPDPLLTEIVALQLFLTNVLSPVACGERMSTEQYQELMRNVKTNKHRAAREVVAQYVKDRNEGQKRHA
jgi:hypothetical protein